MGSMLKVATQLKFLDSQIVNKHVFVDPSLGVDQVIPQVKSHIGKGETIPDTMYWLFSYIVTTTINGVESQVLIRIADIKARIDTNYDLYINIPMPLPM